MQSFNPELLKKLHVPTTVSHKGQNGKVLVIGGSQLFHAASLWALSIASKFVDMVFYASVQVNNEIVMRAKEEFRNGIVVPRTKIHNYIDEADVILIGPGLPRPEGQEDEDDDTKKLTEGLLMKYPEKKWVVDGGSLQVISPGILPKNSIVTPHAGEFKKLFKMDPSVATVPVLAKRYGITILVKGTKDIVSSPDQSVIVSGGNAGMTKGGTGDVLAGLTAALFAKNDAFISAACASYINKHAGDELFKRVGYYFNSSDLVEEIPRTMHKLLQS